MKQVVINGTTYNIDCNAFTYIKYQSFFKTGIIQDMNIIKNYLVKQTLISKKYEKENISEEKKNSIVAELLVNETDEFVRIVTQIVWILIFTANEQIISYESWLKSIKKFNIADKWIAEVTEFAVATFC